MKMTDDLQAQDTSGRSRSLGRCLLLLLLLNALGIAVLAVTIRELAVWRENRYLLTRLEPAWIPELYGGAVPTPMRLVDLPEELPHDEQALLLDKRRRELATLEEEAVRLHERDRPWLWTWSRPATELRRLDREIPAQIAGLQAETAWLQDRIDLRAERERMLTCLRREFPGFHTVEGCGWLLVHEVDCRADRELGPELRPAGERPVAILFATGWRGGNFCLLRTVDLDRRRTRNLDQAELDGIHLLAIGEDDRLLERCLDLLATDFADYRVPDPPPGVRP